MPRHAERILCGAGHGRAMTLDRPRPEAQRQCCQHGSVLWRAGNPFPCTPMPLKLFIISFHTSWQWPRHTVCALEAMDMAVYERHGERGIQEVCHAWATAAAVTTP